MFLKNSQIYKLFLVSLSLSIFIVSCTKKDSLIDIDMELKNGEINTLNSISDQIVVRFKNNIDEKFVSNFESSNNIKTIKFVKKINTALFQLKPNSDVDSILTELNRDSSIDYAEKNYKISLNYTVNDKKAKEQSGLALANFPKAWDITFGNKKTVVAVIDTGTDLTHPDLKNKLVQGYNAIESDKTPMDENGHGTHVSGIVAAETNNKIGIAGSAPDTKIMPIKVLGKQGTGNTINTAYGIVWAVDHGANVLNLSLGGPENETVKRAVEYALEKNVVVVAAMGNSALEAERTKNSSLLKAFPAALPGVISVGAVDFSKQKADFSNYGKWISVVAPGVDILSTTPTYDFFMEESDLDPKIKGYDTLQGTSQASPMVAGLAALVLSRYPSYTPREVKAKIESTATDLGKKGFDNEYGYGLINAAKAVL